jgi:hypothetical protein
MEIGCGNGTHNLRHDELWGCPLKVEPLSVSGSELWQQPRKSAREQVLPRPFQGSREVLRTGATER